MQDNTLAWRVEDACLAAMPALRERRLGDWLLRFSDGITRRANSANPRRPRPRDLDSGIASCASLYREEGLPVLFRIPSIIAPDLDARLEGLGYGAEGETCTLYADLEAVASTRDAEVERLSCPDPAWLAAMAALQGYGEEKAAIYARMVGSLAVPAAFMALRNDGEVAALAYGVIHDGLLCFESVITSANHRGRGYARRLLASLLSWGESSGARGVCLQVEATNAPARSLYRSLGIGTELYRYHYRREPISS